MKIQAHVVTGHSRKVNLKTKNFNQYATRGSMGYAHLMFDGFEEHKHTLWNIMIRGYARIW